MSWATFKTDVKQIKMREAQLFSEFSDAEALEIMYDVAKDEVLRDVKELSTYTDSDIIDGFTTDEQTSPVLKRALAFKQLHLYFMDQNGTKDSANSVKAMHYADLYARECAHFKSFGAKNLGSTVTMLTVQR